MQRRLMVGGMIVLVIGVGACDDEGPVAVDTPTTAEVASDDSFDRTADDEFERVATEEVPGFAGYYQEGDRFVALVRVGSDAAPAREYVARVTAGRYLAPTTVEVRRVAHDWVDLRRAADRLIPLFSQGILTYLDVSERDNAVIIGTPEAQVSMVRAMVEGLGLPDRMVVVIPREPLGFDAQLTDRVRPLRGGLQIQDYNSTGACTLNVNAWIGVTPVVVINSHCSGTVFALDDPIQRPLYQPIRWAGENYIGDEIYDRGPYACWKGSSTPCRQSDAAIVQVTSSHASVWAHGEIARTTRRALGTMGTDTIDSSNPYFRIADEASFFEYSWVGGSIDRVGKEGGWTTSTTVASCVDRVGESGVLIRCMWVVDAPFNPGDSGAPYFLLMEPTYNVPTDVAIQGIHVGSDTDAYYASIAGIQKDFGVNLIVCKDLSC